MATTEQRAADGGTETEMVVGETDAGEPYHLPVEEILTGRGFATGKSGAGKSNTGSVIAEELLERGHPLLIVDADGEYWGLKESYSVLHAGATEECDLQVGPEHAGKLAELALDQHVPIVLDVSGYVDAEEADALVLEVARELFAREQEAMQPFLLLVEEIHEYIPQQGSPGEVGEMLIRIAKRGRKRGLGLFGASQRPASVDKDFITQGDLLVWHRLTWENDVDVAKRVAGADVADAISDLDDGEAFVQVDWAEADVDRVQFRRKHTFDAGATPGLDDVERPELQSIDEDLVGELEEISQRQERKQDRIEQLEAELEAKDESIADLEAEIERLRTADETLDLLTSRLEGTGADVEEADPDVQARLEDKNATIAELREEVTDLEAERDELLEHVDELAEEAERLQAMEDRIEQAERIEEQLERARDVLAVDVVETAAAAEGADREELQAARERIDELEAELERARSEGGGTSDLAGMLEHGAVQNAVDVAKDTDAADRHFDRVLAILASSDGGPLSASEIEPLVDGVETTSPINKVLRSLYDCGVLRRDRGDSQGYVYELDEEFLQKRIQVAEQTA